jgi:hypothetical protein
MNVQLKTGNQVGSDLIKYIHVFIYVSRSNDSPSGGGVEHPHRSPASRRRRKGNPVPGGITGPPCHWDSLVLQVGGWTPGWWSCSVKELLLRNPKKWKPVAIWQNLLRKAKEQKGLFCRLWSWKATINWMNINVWWLYHYTYLWCLMTLVKIYVWF